MIKNTLKTFFKFSTQSKLQTHSISEEQLQQLSNMPSYNQAVKQASTQHFELAEISFNSTLNALSNTERVDLQLIVMKRLTLIYKIQNKNALLTTLLEDIYFQTLAFYSQNNIEYIQILSNLLIHYCLYDQQRGILFLDMLLEQMQKDNTPKIILRVIYFYKGIIEALKGEDFQQSEAFFDKAMQIGLNPIYKGMALNNMACVQIWDCLKKAKTNQEFKDRIKPKFLNLKKALNSFEFEEKNRQTDQINEKQYLILKSLLSGEGKIENIKPEDVLLKSQFSSVSAMNIGEFLYYSGDFKSSLFWLQVSQYSATKQEQLGRVLRSIVLTSLIAKKQQNYEFSENLLIDCLEYSTSYNTFNKQFALQCYSELLKEQKRNYEGDKYEQQAQKMKESLFFWEERKENIQIPDFDFKY